MKMVLRLPRRADRTCRRGYVSARAALLSLDPSVLGGGDRQDIRVVSGHDAFLSVCGGLSLFQGDQRVADAWQIVAMSGCAHEYR